MINKSHLKDKKLKGLTIIFTALIVFFSSSKCFGHERDTTIYESLDIQPEFKYENCINTPDACKKFFMNNFKMPKILLDNSYHGRIIVSFIVEKNSSISNINVIRGMGDLIDKHIIKTVKRMHKWTPGIVNGKTVRSRYILPVSLTWLYGNSEEKTEKK